MAEGVRSDVLYYASFESVFFYNVLDADCGKAAGFII